MIERLVEARRRGPRDEATAERLLAPHLHTGVVVASDTAGLSRMSQHFPLPVVLQRVHGPKARLARHLHGGRPIGTWFADNTTSLFDDPLSAADVLRSMAAVHDDGPVRIGVALHHGRFWLVDGCLYGPDARHVLELAELHCRGGETRITPAFEALLREHDGLLLHPTQQGSHGPTRSVELLTPGLVRPPGDDDRYPLPYGPDVHAAVVALPEEAPADAVAAFDGAYRRRASVLVAYLELAAPTDAASTLDVIAAHHRMRTIAADLLPTERKLWRDLAIAAFVDPGHAVSCAMALLDACQARGLAPTIGIDRGDLYLFPMSEGIELAGRPINQASKLAEDLGEPSSLLATDRALDGLEIQGSPGTWSVSGIELAGRVLRP